MSMIVFEGGYSTKSGLHWYVFKVCQPIVCSWGGVLPKNHFVIECNSCFVTDIVVQLLGYKFASGIREILRSVP